MRTYLILFTCSILTAFLLTPLVRRRAIAWGAIAMPDKGRHIHARPTPRLGGIAIYLAFLVGLALVPFAGNLVEEIFTTNLARIFALLIPATGMMLFGVYDDFRSASAPLKLVVQTIAAAALFASGLRIEAVSSPFGGHWDLPLWLSFLGTAFWVVLITNAFNLIDGIDGLAAGASIFAFLSILIFSIAQGHPEISLLSVVLIGAIMGFLRYNFNPATIFLGDSGSLFLGFMAAGLSLAGSQKGSTIVAIAIPLVSFGLPLTEAGLSLVRRFLSGAPLLAGDRGHIHHRLLDRGLTQRQAAILLYGVCGLFALFGLMLLNPQRNLGALIFFVLGVGIIFGVQHLRYPEFSELGHQLRHRVYRRRQTIAANVRLRRVTSELGQVEHPQDLFKALSHLHEGDEFDCVWIDLRLPEPVVEALRSEAGASREPWTAGRSVLWYWEYRPESAVEMAGSPLEWSLRIPLQDRSARPFGEVIFCRDLRRGAVHLDLHHLCDSLPRELGLALERLLPPSDELPPTPDILTHHRGERE
jgi:UDP-GlcNAc:undecaprenyl-phosphate GlcNAc-1-phosphate transferase